MSTDNVTPIRPSTGAASEQPVPEDTSKSLSYRNADMSLLVSRVLATLDMLQTIARSKDAFADLQTLSARTLSNTLYGLECEIERVHQFIDKLPRDAAALVLDAIREVERQHQEAEEGSDDEARYSEVLSDLISAHDRLDCRRLQS